MRRFKLSVPSFAAGVVAATVLVGVSSTAIMAAAVVDQRPNTYDGTAPRLTLQPTEFIIGQTIDAAEQAGDGNCGEYNFYVPLRMRWTGSDSISGLLGSQVWAADPGGVGPVDNTSPRSFDFTGDNYTGGCGGGQDFFGSYFVVVVDNRGSTATSPEVTKDVTVWEESGEGIGFQATDLPVTTTGSWAASHCVCHNNTTTLFSTQAGASKTYTVRAGQPGQTFAVVMPKSSNRGVVNISVDGGNATSVDTYAATTQNRTIVWQHTFASRGTHTIRLTNAGTSGRSRIDIDGIMRAFPASGQAPEPTSD